MIRKVGLQKEVRKKGTLAENILKYACCSQDGLFMEGCIFCYAWPLMCPCCWQKNHSENKHTTWSELKRFTMCWNDTWLNGRRWTPERGSVSQEVTALWSPPRLLLCLQILTPTSAWWLESPPSTPWCPALAWCLRRSPRIYRLSKRSSTARAAPCSPPTPVSNHSAHHQWLHRVSWSFGPKEKPFVWYSLQLQTFGNFPQKVGLVVLSMVVRYVRMCLGDSLLQYYAFETCHTPESY